MNANQLCQSLGVTKRRLDTWIRVGLPCSGRGSRRQFDPVAVRAWLIERGFAKARQIARTLGEIARHFEVAERTVAYWRGRGMPGSPGAYDLEEIAAWREREGLTRSDEDSERSQLLRIEAQTKQAKLERLLGELAPREPIRRAVVRYNQEAKTLLEQIPEAIYAKLPPQAPAADQWDEARMAVFAAAKRLVASTCQALADLAVSEEITGIRQKTTEEAEPVEATPEEPR